MIKRPQDAGYMQETASMEQVRELLFGAQLKDMEIRAQRQEERFLRELDDVREALKSRLDSLENFLKSETGSLLHRLQEEQAERDTVLKAEQRERAEAVKAEQRERIEAVRAEQREREDALTQAGKDLAAAVEAFERKTAKLSGTLDAVERELRSLLMAESGALSSKIDDRYQDALGVLSKTAAQIRHDMVYRSSLSSMFTEIAVKLSGQWAMEIGQLAAGESADPDSAANVPEE
jgi:chromosome segregation ATPase